MKKLILIKITTIALTLIFANVTYAKPSMQETIDYITKKAKQCGGSRIEIRMLISVEDDLIIYDEVRKCSVSRHRMPLSQLEKALPSSSPPLNYLFVYSMGGDDGKFEKFKIDDNARQQVLSCRGFSCKQSGNFNISGKLEFSNTSSSFTMKCPSIIHGKLVKAFNHLADLVKQKESKTEELF